MNAKSCNIRKIWKIVNEFLIFLNLEIDTCKIIAKSQILMGNWLFGVLWMLPKYSSIQILTNQVN
jgi:hypothetical protein